MDSPYQASEVGRLNAAQVVERLSRFAGPPQEFLVNLLAAQCQLALAEGGAILRPGPEGRAEILAVYPPVEQDSTAPVWLAQAAESAGQALGATATTVKPLHGPDDLYGQPAKRHLVMVPLRGGQDIRGVAAFFLQTADQASLETSRERLELTISLLSLYEMRLALQQRQNSLQQLRAGMETLSAVNQQERFAGAAMAFCNEIASRWQCERVSLGFLKGRYVHLRAMSHTEKFSRKMKLIQDIESAMEECLDQDVEVVHPSEPEASYVSRAAEELSKRHGPTAVLSLPLRLGEEVPAVLTAERAADQPFSLADIESLRLTCELCTARLVNLQQHSRWFGAKVAAGIRQGLGAVVGPRHTWAKLAAVLIFGALVFLALAKGTYQVEAPFVLEAVELQVVPAPFDGYLESVQVRPGQAVQGGKDNPGSLLATLETAELRVELAKVQAERQGYLTQAAAAMRDDKRAEALIAQAQAEQAAAQIKLLQYKIEQARIVSPIKGLVLTGDLERRIGGPVETGEVLFEVAPMEALRAELAVPEDQIADIKVGDRGELAAVGSPGERIKFVVERINPVAQVVDQRNVVKVRARLEQTPDWMKPGMEGLAKIQLEQRSYVALWTRRMNNWLRMKLWL